MDQNDPQENTDQSRPATDTPHASENTVNTVTKTQFPSVLNESTPVNSSDLISFQVDESADPSSHSTPSCKKKRIGLNWFNPLQCFFGSMGHVALDRNPGPGYDNLLLRMIPGDLLSAFPHRQFHTLPGLLESWAALPNSNPNSCVTMQGGNLYHFYDGLWYDSAERRTHDLPCERRTRRRLSPSTKKSPETDNTDNPQSEGGGFDLVNFDIKDWNDSTLGDPPDQVEMEDND